MYVSIPLSNEAVRCRVRPVPFSDHCLVTLHIGKGGRAKSKFYFARPSLFNKKLLVDNIYNESVDLCFQKTAEHVPLFEKWEILEEVKMIAIERSS